MNARRPAQRGQSMAEFIVALAVLLPLFLAISYAARYGDLQQRATQASRYAAFQRAMQPSTAKLPDAKIADQMRARFFLSPMYLNQGSIQADDSVASIKNAKGQPALWNDLAGKALLSSPDQVTLRWKSAPLGSGSLTKALDTATGLVGKDYTPGQQAMVEVQLFNRLNLAEAKPKALSIGATTAAAGNGLGSAGSADTTASAKKMVPSSYVPSALESVMSLAMHLFEKDSPDFGCVKPDVTANHRLEGAANNSTCK